jgi:hypothetical protein
MHPAHITNSALCWLHMSTLQDGCCKDCISQLSDHPSSGGSSPLHDDHHPMPEAGKDTIHNRTKPSAAVGASCCCTATCSCSSSGCLSSRDLVLLLAGSCCSYCRWAQSKHHSSCQDIDALSELTLPWTPTHTEACTV